MSDGLTEVRYVIFEAEVIEVKVRKTASVDKEIKITLITDNVEALKLQEYIADRPVVIDIKEGK